MAILRIGFIFVAALLTVIALANDGAAGDFSTHVGEHKPHKILVLPSDAVIPSVDITVVPDPSDGWNLHIITTDFRFTPERVGEPPRDGEGHAHLYINGEKIRRLYGPWFHLDVLPSGPCTVAVTLNANDHRILASGEVVISASTVVQVP